MNLYQKYGRPLLKTVVAVAVLLAMGACSGITPGGNLRNSREEGPEKGLFSGPGGEFVILAPSQASTNGKAVEKGSEKSTNNEE